MSESCTHHYPDGTGAVFPMGHPDREFKTMRLLGVTTYERSFCLICGTQQDPNRPVEDCEWYQKAMVEWDEQEHQDFKKALAELAEEDVKW